MYGISFGQGDRGTHATPLEPSPEPHPEEGELQAIADVLDVAPSYVPLYVACSFVHVSNMPQFQICGWAEKQRAAVPPPVKVLLPIL